LDRKEVHMSTVEERLSSLEKRAGVGRRPYALIGVLAGIIVLQWAMPSAQGALTSQEVVAPFVVTSPGGKTIMAVESSFGGALLSLGGDLRDQDSPKLRIVMEQSGSSESFMMLESETLNGLSDFAELSVGGRNGSKLLMRSYTESSGAGIRILGGRLTITDQDNRRTELPALVGDLDLDRDVDYDDFFIFAANFGHRAE
jgi:hypothetical protein